MTKHEKEGQLGEDCGCDVHSSCSLHEEKDREELDYEDELVDYGMERGLARKFVSMQKANLKSFLSEKLKEEREKVEEFYMNQTANEHDNLIRANEREKWRLKNAGLYRQLFGEMNPERTFTAKELWKIFDEHTPLFTEEQKKDLKNYFNSLKY